jgi:putative SOS response-associated peptidase YedK
MCGRVALHKRAVEYGSMLKIKFPKGPPNAPAHYNGAPGQDYLIARSDPRTHDTTLDLIRWGLLPSWAKDRKMAWNMINARSESVATAAAFKEAFAKRRCLVPVDTFYEWRKVSKEKFPYMIAMAGVEPFTLAGLWENWKDPESGEWIRTFTIITTRANELVSALHDRMPVIIAPEDRDRWLNGPNPHELAKPYPSHLMTIWPVFPKLNAVKNDTPDLMEPIEEKEPKANEGELPGVNEAARDEPANSE